MSIEPQRINPHPPAMQEKFQRIGWDDGLWVPTPGISFEEETNEVFLSETKELYQTEHDVHMYAMPVSEALALSDKDFEARLNAILENEPARTEAIAEYERRRM